MTEDRYQSIEETLVLGDDQEIADELVDLLEPLADSPSGLDHLLGRYAATEHRALRRVLAFYVACAAYDATGSGRNAVWRLVPFAIARPDPSTLTNLCTAVHRLAMRGVPWDPPDDPAPEHLAALFEAALGSGSRNIDDAVEALVVLADASILQSLDAAQRRRLRAALAPLSNPAARELRVSLSAV